VAPFAGHALQTNLTWHAFENVAVRIDAHEASDEVPWVMVMHDDASVQVTSAGWAGAATGIGAPATGG